MDGTETTTLEWLRPEDALRASEEGKLQMEFATRGVMRSLLPVGSRDVEFVLTTARAIGRIELVEPRLLLGDDRRVIRVMMPSDPEFARGYRE